MIILNSDVIETLLPLEQVIAEVEKAISAMEKGTAMAPKRMHLDFGMNTLLCMPSFNENFYGTKLVSIIPGNREKSLPVTVGAMLLNDATTGFPLALLNASKLTALRTGALGAIGIKYTAPPGEETIGIIGSGVQGMHQAIFACAVLHLKKIFYLQRSVASGTSLIEFVHQHYPHVGVEACQTVAELLDKTNIIIAATTSSQPVLPDDPSLLKGKHFISIGSYKPTMQELPDSVYQLAGQLAMDSIYARYETGDIINPIQNNLVKEENTFTIGKLITREREIDVDATTVYKSAGMALFDLFVAQAMYNQAIKENKGLRVSL
jgi:ornithine cyclodeaminase/alanine dehydrogenase-like protein (mu-crystallin family)